MMKNDNVLDRQTDRQSVSQRALAVIIPVYNGERYLREAVMSVAQQPAKELEVVIINDGSTDDSLRIAEEIASCDERITVLTQKNCGVSVARNRGIEYCIERGIRYIAFLDADDVWAGRCYTQDIKKQLNSERWDAFHFIWYTANERISRGKKHDIEHHGDCSAETEKFGSHFGSYFYRTEILDKYRIRFPIGIRVQEDCVFRYVFFTIARTLNCIGKPQYIYRSNSASVLHAEHDSCDWYLNHILPAWEWAKKELYRISQSCSNVRVKDIDGCFTMQKTYLCELIRVASAQGISFRRIQKCISSSEYIGLFDPKSTVWVDSNSLAVWNAFRRNPRVVWVKYRAYGIAVSLLAVLRNNACIQMIRYRNKVSDIL